MVSGETIPYPTQKKMSVRDKAPRSAPYSRDDGKSSGHDQPRFAPYVLSLIVPAVKQVHRGVGAPGETAKPVRHPNGEKIADQNGEHDPVPVGSASDASTRNGGGGGEDEAEGLSRRARKRSTSAAAADGHQTASTGWTNEHC